MHCHVEILEFPGSYALLAENDAPRTAAVFVHGFLGDAVGTWQSFQDLIEEEREVWDDVDAFFFKYDSFGSSISDSAEDLDRFVESVTGAAAQFLEIPPLELPDDVAPSLQGRTFRLRSAKQAYENLWLVAHSQGGLVVRALVREAVKDAQDAGVDLSDPAKLPLLLRGLPRLFAPAIAGARPAHLLGLALELGGIGTVARAILGQSPSFGEMRQGSKLLDIVGDDTTKFAEEHDRVPALRARVLWADRDDVVSDIEYRHDRRVKERPPGTTHVSICKPRASYRAPLRFASSGAISTGAA